MKIPNLIVMAAFVVGTGPVFAQNTAPATAAAPTVLAEPNEIDCDDPANAEEEVCIALLETGGGGATNFAPLIAGVGGLLGLGALAGGGSSTSTTATGTTGTN